MLAGKRILLILPIAVCVGVCAFVVVSPGTACHLFMKVCALMDDHVQIACSNADLAPLPVDAKVLHSGGWSTGFSNRSCFSFKTTREAIDAWIQNSPSLRDKTPDILSRNHRVISFDSYHQHRKWEQEHPGQSHHSIFPGDPSWFTPNISQGRRFHVRNGRVYVDDANNVVWVDTSTD